MEDEAVPVEVLEGFPEPHIHQHGSVELVPSCLVDDVQAVVELLPCQEWVDVTQECSELVTTVPALYSFIEDNINFY